MVLDVRLVGRAGIKNPKKFETHVHPFNTSSGKHIGMVALILPFIELEPSTKFFINETKGNTMNQAVIFGGTRKAATLLHAGVNSGQQLSSNITGGPTLNLLIDSGGSFDTNAGVGGLIHNTVQNTFARITSVDSNTQLTLSGDIMDVGSEAYILNDIWVGTIVQGTWNFADSAKITITDALNNDEATFTVASTHV